MNGPEGEMPDLRLPEETHGALLRRISRGTPILNPCGDGLTGCFVTASVHPGSGLVGLARQQARRGRWWAAGVATGACGRRLRLSGPYYQLLEPL